VLLSTFRLAQFILQMRQIAQYTRKLKTVRRTRWLILIGGNSGGSELPWWLAPCLPLTLRIIPIKRPSENREMPLDLDDFQPKSMLTCR